MLEISFAAKMLFIKGSNSQNASKNIKQGRPYSDCSVRLLLQKQSDLGLLCLCRHFWQATTVHNFRSLRMVHLFNVIPANDTKESVFGHQNSLAASGDWTWDLLHQKQMR